MAQDEVSFTITPVGEGQAARLETFVGGESVSWVELDGPGLDWLIADLVAARADLAQTVADTFDPAAAGAATEDPAWWVSDPAPGGITLALRHPGAGWLSFLVPKTEAAEMARWLGQG